MAPHDDGSGYLPVLRISMLAMQVMIDMIIDDDRLPS
jgi:hypothetical protein